MKGASPNSQELGEQFLKSLDKSQLASATSKVFAASIGDITIVLSRSPAHKHYSLADIEWLVLPPVAAGQFYVVEATHNGHGFRVPISVVTWAFVSMNSISCSKRRPDPCGVYVPINGIVARLAG